MAVIELWRSSKFDLTRRIIIIVWIFFEMIFFSGVHYGWFQIIPLLQKSGVFTETCVENGVGLGNNTTAEKNSTVEFLDMQCDTSSSFRRVFYVASISQTCFTIVIGLLYDIFGVRLLKLLSCVFFVGGCLIFAFVGYGTSFLLYLAMPLLSISSSMLIVSNYEVSNLFPRYQFAIITFYTGAYDTATCMFKMIVAAYENFGISREMSFIVLAACAFVAEMISIFAFLPKTRFADEQKAKAKAVAEGQGKWDEKDRKIVRDSVNFEEDSARLTKFGEPQTENGENGAVKTKAESEPKPSFIQRVGLTREVFSYVLSVQYFSLVVWSTVMMAFLVNYFATIHFIIKRYSGSEEEIGFYSQLSGYILLGGMFTAPISGFIIDYLRNSLRKRLHSHPDQKELENDKPSNGVSIRQETSTLLGNGDTEADATVRIHETSTNGTAHPESTDAEPVTNGNGESDKSKLKESEGQKGHLAALLARAAHLDQVFSLVPSLLVTTFLCVATNGALFFANLLPFVFVGFTIFRSFMFGTINSSVMIAFPPHHFGKLFGLLYLVIGLTTMVLEPILRYLFDSTDNFTKGGWNGYHTQLYFLIILSLLSFFHPVQITTLRAIAKHHFLGALRNSKSSGAVANGNGNGVAHA